MILNYWRSPQAAEGVAMDMRADGGAVELVEADIGNAAGSSDMGWQVTEKYRGLDILVCNASPSISPLNLGAANVGQAVEFVTRSTALAAVLFAAFPDRLSDRPGWYVVMSSAYVRSLPAEYPHFVAAKAAPEVLARAAVVRRPAVRVLIVRPQKILTDQTNTALGRRNAIPVERVAVGIVSRLCTGAGPQQTEFLEVF